MSERVPLFRLLASAREDLARHAPPADAQAAILARYDAGRSRTPPAAVPPGRASRESREPPVRGRRWRRAWWPWPAAVATLMLASLALTWSSLLPRPGEVELSATDAASASGTYLPLVSPAEWDRLTRPDGGDAGAAPVWLVAAEVPRERLALFGLPFDAARAGEPVRAELMVHPGGQVMAVRLLHARP